MSVAFEDFPEGRVVQTPGVTVTDAHLVGWASLTGDWYPLHMDERWARERGPFGGRVAHGPFIFGLVIGLLERANVFEDAILAWLGAEELRSHAPTFLGDTVRARATVVGSRVSNSDPGRGIVTLRYEALKQDDTIVLTCRYILMMRTSQA